MGGDQSRERTERDEDKPEDAAKTDNSQSQSAASAGEHFRCSLLQTSYSFNMKIYIDNKIHHSRSCGSSPF